MKRRRFTRFLFAALCAPLLAGCTVPGGTPEPTPTPSPAPTLTATPTATPAPTATPSPTPAVLSAKEEKAEILAFWEDAEFSYWMTGLPEESGTDGHYDYYRVVSNYLENRAERQGAPILRDTDDAPCFPYEDFLDAAEAIFGPDTDYTAYIPNEPGPEPGTARVAWGYGLNYVQAELDADSFALDGDAITVHAVRRWVEPGYSEDLGTLTYTFAIQPENSSCRYRLFSLEEESA